MGGVRVASSQIVAIWPRHEKAPGWPGAVGRSAPWVLVSEAANVLAILCNFQNAIISKLGIDAQAASNLLKEIGQLR